MRQARRFGVALCALMLISTGAFAGAAFAGTGGRDLSSEERASLAAGALVSRPLAERRGTLDLLGGTSYQVIDAPLNVVWNALLDTQYYHRMMPRVLEARLVQSGPDQNQRTVYMRQGAGPFVRAYYLNVHIRQDQGDISFSVDEHRPHDLRAAWGFYNVKPYGDGKRTLLAYGVMADLNVGALATFVKGDVHEWLLKVPWTVKRFVEGSGRYIYKQTWRSAQAQVSDKRG
jgi:hypothetical protein